MEKKYFLSLFLLLQTAFLVAQDFKPGYVITREQDTLIGFILDLTDAELSQRIRFRNNEGSKVVKYKPEDLLAFGFNTGRFFESIEVPAKENEETLHFFMKNIIRGEIDLYVLRHKYRSKADYFVHNNSSGKSVLLKKPEKRELVRDGKIYKAYDNHYLGNLQLIKEETGNATGPKYNEKRIKKDIVNYNTRYEQDVPLFVYEDEVAYTFDIMVGMPVQREMDFSFWRASVFINRNRPERTRNFFLTYGVYFENNVKENQGPLRHRNVGIHTGWQILNVMPIALKYQGNGKTLQPYGYIGGGLAAIWHNWDIIEDYEKTSTKTDFGVFPNFNLGIGARIKMGPAAFLAEISPSFRGIFLNAGVSF